jgi:ubiquitin C-terminal hydrolase
VAKAAEQFKDAGQQDSQEFATYLLDCLHEDLNRVQGKKPAVEFPDINDEILKKKGEERYAAECWYLYLQRDKSVIVDLFQGQLRSEVQCLKCSNVSTRFDPFMYLSVPVVDKNGMPLTDLGSCIRAFTQPDKLSGQNQWYCSRCRAHVDAVQRLSLWKLPPILLVHLKRFRYGAHGRAGAPQALGLQPQRGFSAAQYTTPGTQVATLPLAYVPRPCAPTSHVARPPGPTTSVNHLQVPGPTASLNHLQAGYGSTVAKLPQSARSGQPVMAQPVMAQPVMAQPIVASALAVGASKLSHEIACDLKGIDFHEQFHAIPDNSPQKDAPLYDVFGVVNHMGSCGAGHNNAAVEQVLFGAK